MEENKESRNDNNNSKIVIRMGGAAGGGIGAVVLLGGALATAAFASAFVLGKKRQSSGTRNSSPEKSEKEEEKEGQDEHKRTSEVEKEEVEMDSTVMNSAHTLKMEKVGEVEVRKVEDDPISDGFVVVKEQGSDDQVSVERERESDGGSEVCDDGEDVEAVRAEITGVRIDEEKEETGECCNGDGEIIEEKFLEPEATEIAMVDLSGEEDSVEMVEAAVKSEEDEVEEKAVINGCMLPLSPESIGILTVAEEVRENEEDEASMQFDGEKNVGDEVGDELISPEEVEVVKYVANEEVPQNLKLHENEAGSQEEESRDDVERESEREVEEEVVVDGNGNAAMANMVNGEDSRKRDDEEKNNVKTMDFNERGEENSKWEAQWQGEWPKVSTKQPKQTKRISYEVGGKMQEDYSAKDEVMVKDHPSNSTRWRLMIWTLSVLTSLSCSWFFDLSPAKICLAVFLTVFMLEMYGYPLLNRKQAQRLHAASGERVYEQTSSKK